MPKIIRPNEDHGNFTQIHNSMFDHVMRRLSPNAWKILCLIMRKTRGFVDRDGSGRKVEDLISYSQITEGTGIGSPITISKAIKELLDEGVISAHLGKSGVTASYSLNRDYAIVVEGEPAKKLSAAAIKKARQKTREITTTDSVVVDENANHYRNYSGATIETIALTTIETVDTKEKNLNKKERLIRRDSANAEPARQGRLDFSENSDSDSDKAKPEPEGQYIYTPRPDGKKRWDWYKTLLADIETRTATKRGPVWKLPDGGRRAVAAQEVLADMIADVFGVDRPEPKRLTAQLVKQIRDKDGFEVKTWDIFNLIKKEAGADINGDVLSYLTGAMRSYKQKQANPAPVRKGSGLAASTSTNIIIAGIELTPGQVGFWDDLNFVKRRLATLEMMRGDTPEEKASLSLEKEKLTRIRDALEASHTEQRELATLV